MSQQNIKEEQEDLIEELLKAAIRKKLIIFIGAGVSRIAGGPSWKRFADKLYDWLIKNGLASHEDKSISKDLPPKTRISIALDIANKKEKLPSKEDYEEILMTTDEKLKDKGRTLYKHIKSLGTGFVTTNYDEWLDLPPRKDLSKAESKDPSDEAKPSNQPLKQIPIMTKPSDFSFEKVKDGGVLHLHGSMNTPSEMIITTKDYLKHYKNEHNVSGFLDDLFSDSEYHILFMGYGLEEMEILEYIFNKADINGGAKNKYLKFFILQGFYSYEDKLADLLRNYYKNHCSVELIEYSLDSSGYDALAGILSDWVDKISGPPTLVKRRKLEELLKDEQ